MSIVSKEKIIEGIKEVKTSKRKFVQSIDLIINLKGLDLRKPENRVNTKIKLPIHSGKIKKIGIFADILAPLVKDDATLIRRSEIESLAKDKKKAKKLAKSCDIFLAEASLMPLIGKTLGPILAPKGKMPKPIPPTLKSVKPLIDGEMNSLTIEVKKTPIVQVKIGNQEMSDEDLEKNIDFALEKIEAALPRTKENIKDIFIKATMSKPFRLK